MREGIEAKRKNQEIAQLFPSVGGGAWPNLFWKEATADGVFHTKQVSGRNSQVSFLVATAQVG
jgi:hypothetical protein